MKMSRYSTICAVLLSGFPGFLVAAPGKDFTKSIVKEFDIASDGIVGVDNKYGSVDVRPWEEARVKIEVTITVDARSQEKANDVFDRISVKFDNSMSAVRAETDIESVSVWKNFFNWGSSDQFKIDYVVYTPATVELELTNRYGDIYVGDMQGRCTVDLKYGDMRLGTLSGNTNISLSYGDGVVKSVQDVSIDMSYSNLKLSTAGNIIMTGRYSDVEFGTVGDLESNTGYVDVKAEQVKRLTNTGKYDDFIIQDLLSLDVDTKYSSFSIGNLHDFADLESSYGSVEFKHVAAGFSAIDVATSYTDVTIDVDNAAQFVFDVTGKYCDVRHYEVEVTKDIESGMSHTLKGYHGSQNATARVTASLTYGGFTLR